MPDEKSSHDGTAIRRGTGPHGNPVRHRLRVLVADGYRDAADSLALVLTLAGHCVRVVYSGPAALDLARQERPDVVVCDLVLPGLNGYELARRLRPELPQALLIALTGLAAKADRLRSFRAGFDRHLVKPADADDFLELLARVSPRGPS